MDLNITKNKIQSDSDQEEVQYFGLLNEKQYESLNNDKDWRSRASAIEDVMNIIEGLNGKYK